MNIDKLIRDRMKDLGLKYEKTFSVNGENYKINIYNKVLKEAFSSDNTPVWTLKGDAWKWLWKDGFKKLEDSNGK